jgi:hypothetical protein
MRKTRRKLYLLYQIQEITPVAFGRLLEKEVYLYRFYTRYDIPFEYRLEMIESVLDDYRIGLKILEKKKIDSKEKHDELFSNILVRNMKKRSLKSIS